MDDLNKKLSGKNALVTGSGSGLGSEIALELARQGANIAVHYASSKSGAETVADEIKKMGGKAWALKADLREAEEAIALVENAITKLGGLDILVNNSGLTSTMRFLDAGQKDYEDLFNLNMKGMFFCSKAVAKHMIEKNDGVILNMSSIHGLASLPGYSIYAATKGAIIAFTRQLSVELAKFNIRVNCVAPGCIIVPSDFKKNPGLNLKELSGYIPLKKVGKPLDVAKLTAFLASEDANYITGQVMVIDGGILAKAAFSTPEAAG